MCVDLVYFGLRSPLCRHFPKFNPHFAHQAQPGQPSGSPKSPEKNAAFSTSINHQPIWVV